MRKETYLRLSGNSDIKEDRFDFLTRKIDELHEKSLVSPAYYRLREYTKLTRSIEFPFRSLFR